MYLNKKERDALSEAQDFISSNTDSAENQEYFQDLVHTLNIIWKKSIKDLVSKRFQAKKRKNLES